MLRFDPVVYVMSGRFEKKSADVRERIVIDFLDELCEVDDLEIIHDEFDARTKLKNFIDNVPKKNFWQKTIVVYHEDELKSESLLKKLIANHFDVVCVRLLVESYRYLVPDYEDEIWNEDKTGDGQRFQDKIRDSVAGYLREELDLNSERIPIIQSGKLLDHVLESNHRLTAKLNAITHAKSTAANTANQKANRDQNNIDQKLWAYVQKLIKDHGFTNQTQVAKHMSKEQKKQFDQPELSKMAGRLNVREELKKLLKTNKR